MAKNKELWLALSALAATAPVPDQAVAQERAGVTGMIQPDVKGTVSGEDARVLFVGSDVFRNETIRTDDTGITHLLFLDQSTLTIGPDSEVVIDRFVYDPATGEGELSMSTTTGLLRFVGGALSKTNDVSVRTPVGTLGIRGGVTLIESKGANADTVAWFIYGNKLTGTSHVGGDSRTVIEQEYGLRISPDGKIKVIGPVKPFQLDTLLANFRGTPKSTTNTRQVELPIITRQWLDEVAGQDVRDDMRRDETFAADLNNRDIADLAS